MFITRARARTKTAAIIHIPCDEIFLSDIKFRKNFDETEMEKLKTSLKNFGVLKPLLVRSVYGRYELISGERRLRAAKALNLESVPCIISQADMEQAALLSLSENLCYDSLDDTEISFALCELMRLFDFSYKKLGDKLGIDVKEILENNKKKSNNFILRDEQIFINSLERNMEIMKKGGILATLDKYEYENSLRLVVEIRR